ncbi:MAG TPA: eL32 family ribosomal protein, partial [Methanomicrobiales archaeon]|nr:eL32 family ribosomal protein [Methanomicrobiales archaeon]
NEAMLAELDPKAHAIRIAAGVGMKKKMEIQRKAMDAGLKVLNPRQAPAPGEEPEAEPAEEASSDE